MPSKGGIILFMNGRKLVHEMKVILDTMRENSTSYIGNAEIDAYSIWHKQNASKCWDYYSKFIKAIDYPGSPLMFDIKDVEEYIINAEFSSEQIEQIANLESDPYVIRVLGEKALEQKENIENALGIEIDCNGSEHVNSKGETVIAIKGERELFLDCNKHFQKALKMENEGLISSEERRDYTINLANIYDYFASQSRAEQVPFRKISDKGYDEIAIKHHDRNFPIVGNDKYWGHCYFPTELEIMLENKIILGEQISVQAQENGVEEKDLTLAFETLNEYNRVLEMASNYSLYKQDYPVFDEQVFNLQGN